MYHQNTETLEISKCYPMPAKETDINYCKKMEKKLTEV